MGERLVDREAELGRRIGATVMTTVGLSSNPDAELVNPAVRSDADAIFAGSTMRPASRRAFLGPRVEYVVQNAPCPVAVVRSL
nr:universal stress protein [Natronococcus sp. AD5]